MASIDWRRCWWQAGFATVFLAIGVPYWQIPYDRLNLPSALMGAGLAVLFAVTVLTRFYSGKSFMRVTAVLGAVVPAVVMSRVVVDGVLDSTSHNLWPLEIIIAALVGGATALAGALLGSVVLWISRKGQDDEQAE